LTPSDSTTPIESLTPRDSAAIEIDPVMINNDILKLPDTKLSISVDMVS